MSLASKIRASDEHGVLARITEEAEARETAEAIKRDDALERDLAFEDYYRRHPTFGAIVKSMRHNRPLTSAKQIMQAARRAEAARPKRPPPPKEASADVVTPEPESEPSLPDAS